MGVETASFLLSSSNFTMSRDPNKLRVFTAADRLVLDLYRASGTFPVEERYGLQTQIRRAAVSTAANIVEGCARRWTSEYLHFLNIAAGSAAEAAYLVRLAHRLGFLSREIYTLLSSGYTEVLKGLLALIAALEPEAGRDRKPRKSRTEPQSQSPEPRAQSPEPKAQSLKPNL
jgi:four helix bundle protein